MNSPEVDRESGAVDTDLMRLARQTPRREPVSIRFHREREAGQIRRKTAALPQQLQQETRQASLSHGGSCGVALAHCARGGACSCAVAGPGAYSGSIMLFAGTFEMGDEE
jgi:hypothetical protein